MTSQNSTADGTSSQEGKPDRSRDSVEAPSLQVDIESVAVALSEIQDVSDDAADQDIAGLLRRLKQAEELGEDVEGRLDALLKQLDGLLGELVPDPEGAGGRPSNPAHLDGISSKVADAEG